VNGGVSSLEDMTFIAEHA